MALPQQVDHQPTQDNFDKLDQRVTELQKRFDSVAVKGATENLSAVRGTINANATTFAGAGFTVARTPAGDATGDYTVSFAVAFSGVPSVTFGAGSTTGVYFVKQYPGTAATTSAVRVLVFDSAGANKDALFNFLAIGPR